MSNDVIRSYGWSTMGRFEAKGSQPTLRERSRRRLRAEQARRDGEAERRGDSLKRSSDRWPGKP